MSHILCIFMLFALPYTHGVNDKEGGSVNLTEYLKRVTYLMVIRTDNPIP